MTSQGISTASSGVRIVMQTTVWPASVQSAMKRSQIAGAFVHVPS